MHPRTMALLAATLLSAATCTSPAGRDARFVVVGDAVVRDAQTGLEWTRRDDGAGLDWNAADAYCRGLSLGGAGWRLPDIDELHALYGGTARTPCGDMTCAIDPVFTLGSRWV